MDKRKIWHSTRASADPRIVKMRAKYGLAGYGCYWVIIAAMHKSAGKKLLIINDPRLRKAMKDLSFNQLLEFITDCVNEYDLFKTDGTYFWSDLPDTNIFAYQENKPTASVQ